MSTLNGAVLICMTMAMLLVLSANALRINNTPNRNVKIQGGSLANKNEFPFLVSLQQAEDDTNTTYSHQCGGSILNDRFILSAAHCFDGTPSWIVVYGNNSNICGSMAAPCTYSRVKTIHNHPLYSKANNFINDVAVLELETPITLDGLTSKAVNIEAGTIPTDGTLEATVAGWGTVVTGSPLPTNLMKVGAPVQPMKVCNDMGLTASSPSQVCAGDGNGRDSCQGDSGGPLFYKVPNSVNDFVHFGIVSFGPSGCGTESSKTNRGIYANTTYYMDFIKQFTTSFSTKNYEVLYPRSGANSLTTQVSMVLMVCLMIISATLL